MDDFPVESIPQSRSTPHGSPDNPLVLVLEFLQATVGLNRTHHFICFSKKTSVLKIALEAFSAVFLETTPTQVTPESSELYFIFGPKSIRSL